MKLLLDTHVWLWWQMAPQRLRPEAANAIADHSSDVYLSTVSSWEMAIKIAAGKLQLPRALHEMVSESLTTDTMRSLPVQHTHCFDIAGLPMHHRDPFDRMLIAQARAEKLTVVAADPMFERYAVDLLRT